MQVIGWRELRLTPEETKGIARLRGKTRPDNAAARLLHSRTGGWAAGLVLLLERAKLDGVEPGSLKRQTPEEIVDYFSSEILRNLDQGTREFLLRSAFLPRLSARTAMALSGEERAGRILSSLHRQNYFTQRLLSDEPVYEFHALFREFLLSRAVEAFPPQEIHRIRRTAAGLLEEAGQFEDAVGLYRGAGDWEGLARIIMTQAPALLAQGRGGMILEWMSHLPQEAIAGNPWLLCWKGFCLLPMNPVESRVCFEQAFPMFRSRGEAPGIFLAWSGAVESIIHGFARLDALDAWFSLMDDLIREYGEFPSPEIEARTTMTMVKAISIRRPSHPGVEAWAQRALSISRVSPAASLKIECLVNLALFWHAHGEVWQTGETINALKNLLKGGQAPPFALVMANYVEMCYSLVTAQFDHCMKSVSDGLSLADATGIHLLDGGFLGHGALVAMNRGSLPTARAFLRRMEASASAGTPWARGFFHYLSGWEALALGDGARASSHVACSRKFEEEVGNPQTEMFSHLLAAFVARHCGNDEKSALHLARAKDCSRSGGRTTTAIVLFVDAFLHLESGQDGLAMLSLAAGMRTARETGLYNPWLWKAGLLERLAAAALEAGIEVEYAREVIRRNRLQPDPARHDLGAWPWPVKVHTLGGFELLRDDQPISFSRKVQQKPLQLLKTLIALGGRDVAEEQITDVLWPEAEGDLAHQSFSAALHRLRKLLGDEEALELKEARLTLSNSVCWVDARAFEQLVAEVEKPASVRGREARRVALLMKATALYKGSFLPGEATAPAFSSMRARLRSKFLRSAEELGMHLEKGERWEEAAACYRQGVDADELSEGICRRLIACCLKAGRKVEAASVYRRCEAALAEQGRKPSLETVNLLR